MGKRTALQQTKGQNKSVGYKSLAFITLLEYRERGWGQHFYKSSDVREVLLVSSKDMHHLDRERKRLYLIQAFSHPGFSPGVSFRKFVYATKQGLKLVNFPLKFGDYKKNLQLLTPPRPIWRSKILDYVGETDGGELKPEYITFIFTWNFNHRLTFLDLKP